jgi:hypothetical protein
MVHADIQLENPDAPTAKVPRTPTVSAPASGSHPFASSHTAPAASTSTRIPSLTHPQHGLSEVETEDFFGHIESYQSAANVYRETQRANEVRRKALKRLLEEAGVDYHGGSM